MKSNIVAEVNNYFAQLHEQMDSTIDEMNYIQTLGKYKLQVKKTLLGLKSISKCFNPDNHKIMRTLIKYKSENIKNEVQKMDSKVNSFLRQIQNNSISFVPEQQYQNLLVNCLNGLKRM